MCMCVREKGRERQGAAVLAAWAVSVLMKQKLRHTATDSHPGRGGGAQRHNLGRIGHGESESGKEVWKEG